MALQPICTSENVTEKFSTDLTISIVDIEMEKTSSEFCVTSGYIVWTHIIFPKCPGVCSTQTAEMHVNHHLETRPQDQIQLQKQGKQAARNPLWTLDKRIVLHSGNAELKKSVFPVWFQGVTSCNTKRIESCILVQELSYLVKVGVQARHPPLWHDELHCQILNCMSLWNSAKSREQKIMINLSTW